MVVRVFPLEDYGDKEIVEEAKMGIIYIEPDKIEIYKDKKNIDKLFKYIPADVDEFNPYLSLDEVPVKPIKLELLKDDAKKKVSKENP
ncbi:MAG: hypothetical protein IJS56_00355 [Bacilli bacterium]|nr:hypothetical protein [Bacilli bacterium]